MQVTAKLKHLRMSPRKVRLVADIIRGRDVSDAINQLNFMNKRAARPLLKLLNSAVANAENNSKLKRSNLYISELRVDAGPIIKRWQPRAMGRATPINKRTSHISIVLDEKKVEGVEKKEVVGTEQRSVRKDKKEKKIDKDVKIVKSLDEVKELEKKEEKLEKVKKPPVGEEHKAEIKDIRREGKDRRKQHLDAVKKKGKGGILKRMFRRKSI